MGTAKIIPIHSSTPRILLLLDGESKILRASLPGAHPGLDQPLVGMQLGEVFRLPGATRTDPRGLPRLPARGRDLSFDGSWALSPGAKRARLHVFGMGPGIDGRGLYLASLSIGDEGGGGHEPVDDAGPAGVDVEDIEAPCMLVQRGTRTILDLNGEAERLLGWKKAELRQQRTLMLHESENSFRSFGRIHERPDGAGCRASHGIWRLKRRDNSLLSCHVVPLGFRKTGPRKDEKIYMLIECGIDESSSQFLLHMSEEAHKLLVRVDDFAHGMARQAPDFRFGHRVTRRQEEIIALLSRGLSSKEMGRELGLSESTVNNHIQALYRKYNVSSRLALLNALRGIGYFEHA